MAIRLAGQLPVEALQLSPIWRCNILQKYFATFAKKYLQKTIKSRFAGDIIFITPIYPSITKRIKKSGFVKYEGIVAQRANDAGISVIRGINFKWDTILSTSSKKILWDGIHPTELGYRIYAENVEKQIDAI